MKEWSSRNETSAERIARKIDAIDQRFMATVEDDDDATRFVQQKCHGL